jgi:hypothetical protein
VIALYFKRSGKTVSRYFSEAIIAAQLMVLLCKTLPLQLNDMANYDNTNDAMGKTQTN